MKNILIKSTFMVALTGFSGVLLSAAHSHTMNKAWVELRASQIALQDIQEPVSAPVELVAPETIVAAVWPVSNPMTTPLRPQPQRADALIVGDLQLTTSLRPKVRPRVFLASGGAARRATPAAQPVQKTWGTASSTVRTSGHVARNNNLPTGFEAPANSRLQRWLENRPAYDLGTQVGVFR